MGDGRGQVIRSSRGGLILSLALLGFFCGPLAPLCAVAWVMGAGDLKEMNAGNMETRGRSNTGAGHRIGIVGTILYAIGLSTYFILKINGWEPRR